MIKRSDFVKAQQNAVKLLRSTGIFFRDSEFDRISVADFGLGDLENFGGQILTIIDTERVAAKFIALTPFQILPEHWHPQIGEYEGKEETLRMEWGVLYFYCPGEPSQKISARIPKGKENFFQSRHEIIMLPGDMQFIPPATPHWFQAGPQGAVVWSVSSQVLDLKDEFTDPSIKRETILVED